MRVKFFKVIILYFFFWEVNSFGIIFEFLNYLDNNEDRSFFFNYRKVSYLVMGY